MKRFSRKLIALITMLAFFVQMFSPVITFAQNAENNSAQIQKSIDEFKPSYDAVMALQPLEMGSLADFSINAIDKVGQFFSDIGNALGGETKEEYQKRKAEEEYNSYKAQIDRANQDIVKLKADTQATMDMLTSGAIDAAAKTDTVKSYNSIIESGGALGVYQKALKEAGEKLVDIGDKIGIAASVIATIAAILVPIAVVCPAVAPAIPILGGVAIGIEVVSGVIKAVGNTLITNAEKAIASDKEFLETTAREFQLQTVETGTNILLDQTGVGVAGKAVTNGLVGGLLGSVREIDRAGATGADAAKIAGTEFANSGISAAVGAMFSVSVSGMADVITSDVLSDPDLGKVFKTDKLRKDFGDAVDSGLGQALDNSKTKITDELSLEDPPKANSKPSLGGGGSW